MLSQALPTLLLFVALVRLFFREVSVRALERQVRWYAAQHESDQHTLTEWRRRWERFELDPRTRDDGDA